VDFKQLASFVHVAELGSFTRASAVLAVAQPALSRHVRALEVELRQTLLQRNGRGVTLTEAGKRLLAHGRGILQQVERARIDLENHRGVATGRLVVGLPPSVSRMLTTPLVGAFRERFPKASLSVVEGLSSYVLEWLTLGRVDCAVVYDVAPTSSVELLPVLDEPLYLVGKRGATLGRRTARLLGPPVTLADVARQALVIPSRPHSVRMLLETALAKQGLKAKVALEIESVPAMLDLILEGGLKAVLALNAVRSSGREERFEARPITQPKLATTLWIATSTQRPSGPLVDQTVALLKELLLRERD
jgi:LysR family transcriptional regulator, nitrogen assimilation regulatory protein